MMPLKWLQVIQRAAGTSGAWVCHIIFTSILHVQRSLKTCDTRELRNQCLKMWQSPAIWKGKCKSWGSWPEKGKCQLGISRILVRYMTLDISESCFQTVGPVSLYSPAFFFFFVSKCSLHCCFKILLFLLLCFGVVQTFPNIHFPL